MPGIVGFAHKNLGHRDKNFLQKMALALEPEESFRIEPYHDQNVGIARVTLGIVNSAPQPVWNDRQTVCLVMDFGV